MSRAPRRRLPILPPRDGRLPRRPTARDCFLCGATAAARESGRPARRSRCERRDASRRRGGFRSSAYELRLVALGRSERRSAQSVVALVQKLSLIRFARLSIPAELSATRRGTAKRWLAIRDDFDRARREEVLRRPRPANLQEVARLQRADPHATVRSVR